MSDDRGVKIPGLGTFHLNPDEKLESILDAHLKERLHGSGNVQLLLNLCWTLCCAAAKTHATLAAAMSPPRDTDEIADGFSSVARMAIDAVLEQDPARKTFVQ
jgi:hypothetical protein